MRYIISDIHGHYREYIELLKKINFSQEDRLYILGDVVDRGPQPIEVLQDIMKRDNITYIIGNHDYDFKCYIDKLGFNLCNFTNEADKFEFISWSRDGGIPTIDGFLDLSCEEKNNIYNYINNASAYEQIEYKEKKYILVHAGISNFCANKLLEEYSYEDFISERIDYSRRYYKDVNTFIITGHTPTCFIRQDSKALVYMGNGHIAIDCGCSYMGNLAAYCIETGKTEYVENINKIK